MQHDTIDEQVRSVIVRTYNQKYQEPDPDTENQTGEMQDVYVLIVREREEAAAITVEATPLPAQKISLLPAYAVCGLYLLCILVTLAFQLYCIANPEVATITIVPKSQVISIAGTVQLGRLIPPLTISQSQTAPTTGRGHQDARSAVGTVTFYNGQQITQTVRQGTVFTERAGVSIETTQQATIPPGNPGTGYGTVTVTARALQAGSRGNIQAGDVNTPIALAVFVRNNRFSGGQDERTYATVTQKDIHSISTMLKTTLAKGITGALQDQVQPPVQLFILPCTPTVTSDHNVGEEATKVTVTVSQTCSAVSYNKQLLAGNATTLLADRAQQKIGAGYSLFGTVSVSVKQATVTNVPYPLVFLRFQAQGFWVYALNRSEQLHIKSLIAGKASPEALKLLAALPGVEHTTIRFAGIGDPERLPKNIQHIHLVLLVT